MGARAMITTLPYKIKADSEEEIFRDYVTRTLKLIAKNTGQSLVKEYAEIIHPPKVDNRSANEIVDDIVARTGIEVI